MHGLAGQCNAAKQVVNVCFYMNCNDIAEASSVRVAFTAIETFSMHDVVNAHRDIVVGQELPSDFLPIRSFNGC